jgi:Lipocalin-like domain
MRRCATIMSAIAVAGYIALPCSVLAQKEPFKQQLVGVWDLVSFDYVLPDGNKASTFGHDPKGVVFFDISGRCIMSIMRSDRPKYATNDRTRGTAKENKATAEGTISYFGTYTVNDADGTLNVHVVGSSFPNWNGTDQKRNFTVSGDELKLINPSASIGTGRAESVWRRAKAEPGRR